MSRILIAENDGDVRGLLAGWLEARGHICTQADARDALTEARQRSPDAAVVGVGVPDSGGMFVLRTLRAQAEHVAIVVVCTPPSLDVAVAAGRLGAVDCLPWPTSATGVVDAVSRALECGASLKAADQSGRRVAEEIALGRRRLTQTIQRVDPETAPTVLLAVLEARAPDTHDHSHRVARSAVALARMYNLPPQELQDLRRAALLHDVGKIAIPERLLNAGPLTDADLSALRTHVTIGEEVLASVPVLAAAATIVAATHERYDGSGYPTGLSGDAIPLAARIICVADAYDAMTSRRSYSDPVSHDDANAELVRGAGTHFDPDVVRAWMQMTGMRRCS